MAMVMKTAGSSTLLYRTLAATALCAGTLGLLLPLLPTTPFVLVSLWASARGAPELHERIRANPRIGPSIRAWQEQRAVPRRAKGLACACMTASWLVAWVAGAGHTLLFLLAALFAAVGVFLLTRPDSCPTSAHE